MAKQSVSGNLAAVGNVITTLATDAAQEVEGIRLPDSKKSHGAVSVYFIQENNINVEFYVDIMSGFNVPETVSKLQEKVKSQIERATKYRVHAVNVHVMDVILDGQV